MEVPFRYYQRLLARDKIEACQLAREEAKKLGLRATVDRVFVPALALAARDESSELLLSEDRVFVASAAVSAFETLVEEEKEDAAKKEEKEEKEKAKEPQPEEGAELNTETEPLLPVPVEVWPLSPLGETAANFLTWILRDSPAEIEEFTSKRLLAEVEKKMAERKAVAMCILMLDQTEERRVRQSVKWLLGRDSAMKIVVANLATPDGRKEEIIASLREAGATAVATSLEEAAAALLPFVQDAARRVPEPAGGNFPVA
jgi:hypothetical protein